MYGRTCDTEPGRFHTPAAAQSRQSFAARARVRPARSATAASATRVVRERPRGSGPSRGRVCLSSADIHRNVLAPALGYPGLYCDDLAGLIEYAPGNCEYNLLLV